MTYRDSVKRRTTEIDRTSPLRRIVDVVMVGNFERLSLECGHIVPFPAESWRADYSPGERRRCRPCFLEANPADSRDGGAK